MVGQPKQMGLTHSVVLMHQDQVQDAMEVMEQYVGP